MFSSAWLDYLQVRLFQHVYTVLFENAAILHVFSDLSFFIGVVLKVEVRVTFPASALSRNTPVMQAVLFEDPNDARFLKVWPVSQVRNMLLFFY